MSTKTVVFLLPYLVSLLVKLWSMVVDPRLMLAALDNLALIPKPPEVQFRLDADQQQVIVAHLTQANIKSAVVVTFFSSFIAALAAVFEAPNTSWTPISLIVILVLGFLILAWVIPSRVPELTSKRWFGVEKGKWALVFSCVYDVILAFVAYCSLHRGQP